MRSLIYIFVSALAISMILLAAGCSKKSSSEVVTGNGGIMPGCPNNVCLNNSAIKFAASNGTYNSSYASWYNIPVGNLTVAPGMSAVLQEAMGICNRSTYSGGTAGCDSYVNGKIDFLIDAESATSSNLVMRMTASPSINPYYYYSYSFPSFKDFALNLFGIPAGGSVNAYNPVLALGSSAWPINNSQGFEARAYGPKGSYAQYKLFQLQVQNGKFDSTAMNFSLYYNGALAASGTLRRVNF